MTPNEWILANLDAVVALIFGVLFLLLIVFLIQSIRLRKVQKRYRMLMKGMQQGNLEEVLFTYSQDVTAMRESVRQVVAEQEKQAQELQISCGPIGVVRYNAFVGMGSDLSYSIAVLNRDGDGAVFTSIFGREESRSYAKPVQAGDSAYPLSDEEKQAISLALEKMK
ncbi:hypothetical protein CIG75_00295 [Tumebacillus algifaecis]|uniref:DUF4446 domain-containing protein n=1 Tax=Tumebacillus algifaecis TaxID=1214604 RepID=A0A223CWK2_9BACL|nr:DUF4446 family protein [Tumebacillus algifaecis]ASS73564.1 hypothetical protein CIG75_00295 [Tumebacillus algifaecis]